MSQGHQSGVFIIIHPTHLRKGSDPATATLLDIQRTQALTRQASGVAIEMKDGTLRCIKNRNAAKHPTPSKEVTVELTTKGKLLVVRGTPDAQAVRTIDTIRSELKLNEPDKYNDNCPRCGSWVQFKDKFQGADPEPHMAPCGVSCEKVFVPSAHHHPHHSSQQCDLNTCSGGIVNPYTIIREVFPDGSAYDRWGIFIAKLPPEGIDEYRQWRGFTVKVWV
ncbi:hypothetical protein N9917_01585 [Deltaproteobacteria bacterium]|nr:hypothetical protein [Deltaproteobacteria bacterium]